ncbi:hypothetical protein [Pantoea agglomerans]|uniref:Uncharacterized protein n=1 Tax=Enterobacter agglomerans TaxID=549 RepID=A0ACC5RKZ2_ENTAG|nr:hypothetical protein [Pantoea agglomerans]MBK4725329.1 hypothetical protein [Pantoea agglomerans]
MPEKVDGHNIAALRNLTGAGITFMFTAWIQSQMSDLIILSKNKFLIKPFIENEKEIPHDYHVIRVKYWEFTFSKVLGEFINEFGSILSEEDEIHLKRIMNVRNFLGHSHVSIARDYLLHAPSGTQARKQEVFDSLGIFKPYNCSEPPLALWDENIFIRTSNEIEHIDQSILAKVADYVGIPHGRIR